jgi:hypothetical protein
MCDRPLWRQVTETAEGGVTVSVEERMEVRSLVANDAYQVTWCCLQRQCLLI